MGLLEDAIAQGGGADLAQLSPFFRPSPMTQVYDTAMATPANMLPAINPDTRRPWGDYSAIYQNNDTEALRKRDTERTKILQVIGQLDDPELQHMMLRQTGFLPATPSRPPSIEGISPTDALGVQQAYQEGGPYAGNQGFMGGKLKNELIRLKFQHALNAPERERDRALKEFQAEITASNAMSQDQYRRDQINARNEALKNQDWAKLNHLNQLMGAMAGPGGDPNILAGLKQLAGGLVTKLLQQDMAMGGGGPPGITPMAAGGGEISAPAEAGSMDTEDTSQNPWWDKIMPSNAPTFQPDQQKIAQLTAQLEHLKRFAPGDVGGQLAIARQIQNAMMPPINVYGGGAGSSISAPAKDSGTLSGGDKYRKVK